MVDRWRNRNRNVLEKKWRWKGGKGAKMDDLG